ncbi:MAG TPA: DUF4126 domain-containing protein [Rubrobacteraceae bacterium]|nr:DUF4126 domain-containing protein [Rubrobacteraceae bacterium]
MLGMEILLALGIGIGFASVAGVRAFLPLAALFAALGLFEPTSPYVDVDGGGWWWSTFGVLAALALVESVLDKIPALDRAFNYAMVPVRIASGAVLFAAALGMGLDPGSAPWLVAGGAIAGVVAVAKVILRPPAKAVSAGVSPAFLSFFEDVVAMVGGALGFFVPLVPLAPVAFLLYFYYRVRRRRGRKYGGLRILGD